ncbi:hypothetical protein ACFQJD_01090 [Haloplanus sp. GCM10025708]
MPLLDLLARGGLVDEVDLILDPRLELAVHIVQPVVDIIENPHAVWSYP